jgi:hypothetical protein
MCETARLKKIKASCGESNAPNLKTTIWLAFKEEVEAMPTLLEGSEYQGNIAFRSASAAGVTPSHPAGGFVEWEISELDSSLVDEPQGDKENRSYNSTVKCFINKANAEKMKTIQATNGAALIMLVKDGNGQFICIGDKDKGVTLKAKRQTSPKNGFDLEFMIENQPNMAPYYTGNVLIRA